MEIRVDLRGLEINTLINDDARHLEIVVREKEHLQKSPEGCEDEEFFSYTKMRCTKSKEENQDKVNITDI